MPHTLAGLAVPNEAGNERRAMEAVAEVVQGLASRSAALSG
jgi:hypothetical protein